MTKLIVKAKKIKAKNLKPGDLFSALGQEHWDINGYQGVGQKIYFRTDTPTPEDQANDEIYKITLKRVKTDA